jgi:hypothetical protein
MPSILREIIATGALLVLVVVFGAIACGMAYIIVAIVRNHKPNQRRKAIWQYARQLGTLLQNKYGKQQTYTPLQVKTTLIECGYSSDYDCYGLAMYCNDLDFAEYHRSIDEYCNYESMRSEISECLFSTDREFSPASLGEASFQIDSRDAHTGHHIHYEPSGHVDAGHQVHQDIGGYSGGDFGSEIY